MAQVILEESWKNLLNDEFKKPYFNDLIAFIKQEKAKGEVIYPAGSQIFNAFKYTPVSKVKAVIIGQDPYHGEGQANGLCFSVNEGMAIPPSLQNIFKELVSDIPGFKIPPSGNLTYWAQQGVLLLNATLTVRKNQAGSHQQKGWEVFTDAAISALGSTRKNLVFMLWGKFAQSKEKLLNQTDHLILKAAHPSPLSAYNGFFGCKHFSKCNEYLKLNNQQPIDWQL